MAKRFIDGRTIYHVPFIWDWTLKKWRERKNDEWGLSPEKAKDFPPPDHQAGFAFKEVVSRFDPNSF